MASTIGLNPTGIDDTAQFGVNEFGSLADHDFLYVKINGAVGAKGEVVVVDTDGNAHPITTSVDLIGRRVGIAPDAAAIGTYCWVLYRGDTEFLVAANCAAHKSLRATTVGGVVDDAGSGPVIEGMYTTVAAGAMQTLVKGRLIYPTLQEAGGVAAGFQTSSAWTIPRLRLAPLVKPLLSTRPKMPWSSLPLAELSTFTTM